MRLKWTGWILTVLGSALPLTVLRYTPPPGGPIFPPSLVLVTVISLLGLLIGHGLLIAAYRRVFEQTSAVVVAVVTVTVLMYGLNPSAGGTSSSLWAESARTIGSLWLLVMLFDLGIVFAFHLYYRDRAVRLFGVIALAYVWSLLLYFNSGIEPVAFLEAIVTARYPIHMQVLLCLAAWIVPLGAASFIYHTVRLVHHEFGRHGAMESIHE